MPDVTDEQRAENETRRRLIDDSGNGPWLDERLLGAYRNAIERRVEAASQQRIAELERGVDREMQMRRMAADALESGEPPYPIAMYLRYISSEEPSAANLEWARQKAAQYVSEEADRG